VAEVLDKSWVGWRPIGLGSGLGRGHALIDQENFGEVVERLVITVSTVTVGSDFDGAAADGRAYAEKFSGTYLHRVLKASDIMCQEAPGAFIDAHPRSWRRIA
jgi:hypothetical protein